MPGSMMSVHVGQCGNQLGQSFWKQTRDEHGIDSAGLTVCEQQPDADNKEAFFYQADDNHYVPRAVLVDLEPRVINGMLQNPDFSHLFNRDNIYMSSHGGGAGNNWASGFAQGNEVYEAILDMIEREVENCELMDGFLFTHSISGGTGSGLGSVILEKLRDRYPKQLIQTYSVFANQQGSDAGDVIVSPYNSVLSIERLIDFADDVFVLDNAALNRLAAGKFQTEQPTFDHINSLVSRIMSTSTAPIRFNSPLWSSVRALNLTAFPPMRFIQAGFSPVVDPNQTFTRKTSVADVVRFLLKPSSMMVSNLDAKRTVDYMLGGVILLQGSYDPLEVYSLQKSYNSPVNNINRCPWDTMDPLRITKCPSSPYIKPQYKVSGLMLKNSTNISKMFTSILSQFSKLRSKKAFVDKFEKEQGFSLDMMDSAAERVDELVQLYKEAATVDFMN